MNNSGNISFISKFKNIKEELGDGDSTPEKKELQEKAKTKKWSSEVAKTFQKELDKIRYS